MVHPFHYVHNDGIQEDQLQYLYQIFDGIHMQMLQHAITDSGSSAFT